MNWQVDEWEKLTGNLSDSGQRLLVPLSAEREECLQRVASLSEGRECLVLSERDDLEGSIPLRNARNLLGREAELVVFDAFDRFPVDALCIAAGLLRGGGPLLMLLPPEGLPLDDPEGCWQGQQGKNRFIHYLFEEMKAAGALWQPGERVPRFPHVIATGFFGDLTEDQEWALDWLCHEWPELGPQRILVAADRGRGKSVLLGRYAASLDTPLVVTAASRQQVGTLLNQLPEDRQSFLAPDEILRRGERIECLIIDEAAMLPLGLLKDCLELADRALLATTLNGYEGTGQGFRLRFLRDQGEGVRVLELEHAVRWGQGDLLEVGLNQALLLKPDELPVVDDTAELTIEAIDGEQLVRQRSLLRQAHALMLDAHYRYKPSDLRQWLDDPSQRLYLALRGEAVIGVLQINCEGGLDEALANEVLMGRRRPQGHLLAQMLTAQAGLREFARYRGWRIQRIAVREDQRRRGVGRALLQRAREEAGKEGVDWLGSSFALDAEILPFWKNCGFEALHLGHGRGTSSGRQSLAVVEALDPNLQTQLEQQKKRWLRDLPLHLRGYAGQLGNRDLSAMLRLLPKIVPELLPIDQDVLDAVIDGHFGLELGEAVLARWLLHVLRDESCLEDGRRQQLIEVLLQGRDPGEGEGRKSLHQGLREDLARLREFSPYRTS